MQDGCDEIGEHVYCMRVSYNVHTCCLNDVVRCPLVAPRLCFVDASGCVALADLGEDGAAAGVVRAACV